MVTKKTVTPPAVGVGDTVRIHYKDFFGVGTVQTATGSVLRVIAPHEIEVRYQVPRAARIEGHVEHYTTPRRAIFLYSVQHDHHTWSAVLQRVDIKEPKVNLEPIKPVLNDPAVRTLTAAEQQQALDSVMDVLKEKRRHLIQQATAIAIKIVRKQGTVTSTDVFAALRKAGVDLTDYDSRWMGAVFRDHTKWERVGERNAGSHGRRVSVWTMKSA